jgi:hypothetical protein
MFSESWIGFIYSSSSSSSSFMEKMSVNYRSFDLSARRTIDVPRKNAFFFYSLASRAFAQRGRHKRVFFCRCEPFFEKKI